MTLSEEPSKTPQQGHSHGKPADIRDYFDERGPRRAVQPPPGGQQDRPGRAHRRDRAVDRPDERARRGGPGRADRLPAARRRVPPATSCAPTGPRSTSALRRAGDGAARLARRRGRVGRRPRPRRPGPAAAPDRRAARRPARAAQGPPGEAARPRPARSSRRASTPAPAHDPLDEEQRADLEESLRRLVRTMHGAPRARRRVSAAGRVDGSRTMRQSMRYDGIPFRPVTVSRPHDRPRLVVLVDVSLSVRATSRFTLHVVHGLSSLVSQVRSWAFVADAVETTDLFAERHAGRRARPRRRGAAGGRRARRRRGLRLRQRLRRLPRGQRDGAHPAHDARRPRRRPRQRARPERRGVRGDDPAGPGDGVAHARAVATRGAWAAATCRSTPSTARGCRWCATCPASTGWPRAHERAAARRADALRPVPARPRRPVRRRGGRRRPAPTDGARRRRSDGSAGRRTSGSAGSAAGCSSSTASGRRRCRRTSPRSSPTSSSRPAGSSGRTRSRASSRASSSPATRTRRPRGRRSTATRCTGSASSPTGTPAGAGTAGAGAPRRVRADLPAGRGARRAGRGAQPARPRVVLRVPAAAGRPTAGQALSTTSSRATSRPAPRGCSTSCPAGSGRPCARSPCDAACVPLPDGASTSSPSLHLLEHVDAAHGARILTEATRLARRRVVVAVPIEDDADATFGHVRTIGLDDLRRAGESLRATGWTARVDDHHGGWLTLDRPDAVPHPAHARGAYRSGPSTARNRYPARA